SVVKLNESTNGVRAFYGFTSDDRWLALAKGSPDDSQLVIIDLDSSNTPTPVTGLPANPDSYRPQPAFSSDGRYLCYFIQTAEGINHAVLYDITGRHEQLRVPGASSSLGPPTRQGKWFFDGIGGIECWDVVQKRRDVDFRLWPKDYTMRSTSLSPDERSVRSLSIAESRKFPTERIFLNRCDFATRTVETVWEYKLPPSAHLFWNGISSDPTQFLLIKTLDDQGDLVQDLLDVDSGKVLVRFPRPISMLEELSYSYTGQFSPGGMGAGLIHTLGRTGEIAIDSERHVLASKQVSRDAIWWKYFEKPLSWLGVRQAPPGLYLQFHSAQNGQLLEHIALHTAYTPYKLFDPVLAMHPSEPILAVVDEHPGGPRLRFWRMPPPKPWGWIGLCALTGGACMALLRIVFGKIRKRKARLKALD
ncbi:MAG TPA: hypothetical protein VGG61_00665, partial [Gemmataceae bacterium]